MELILCDLGRTMEVCQLVSLGSYCQNVTNAGAEREIKKRVEKTCTCLNSDACVSFPSD